MLRVLIVVGYLLTPWVGRADFDPVPRLQTIAPTRGPVEGGTLVALNGQNFDLLDPSGLVVTFGGSPGTDVQRVSDNLITVIAPLHSQGSVFVRLAPAGVPNATFGRRVFVFDENLPPVTTTTTTTPGATSTSTTTSTTLPCTECFDGNSCTSDLCVQGGCDHRQPGSAADVLEQAEECRVQFVPVRIGERFLQGCQLVAQGEASADPVVERRLLKAAVSVYTRALRAARQAGQQLDSGVNHKCARQLEDVLAAARAEARALSQQ